MRRRFLLPALLLALAAALLAGAAPAVAAKKPRRFEVCHAHCRFTKIQKAVDAAGAYAFRHRGVRVKVAVDAGRYHEEVALDGSAAGKDFDRMTIEGTRPDRKRTVLDGRGTYGPLGPARFGILAVGVDGLTVKNLWARNYAIGGFMVEGSPDGAPCIGYTLENLLASADGYYGLAAQNCFAGKMLDSAAFRHGAAGFAVLETPCDRREWSAFTPAACQSRPRWTLLSGNASYENANGFLGSSPKYVRLLENVFYDDGAGIVVSSAQNAGLGPNTQNMIERNFVFWNNYNYYLGEAKVEPKLDSLGEMNGRALSFPIGVGIAVYGGYGDIVRANHVFGNFKWGIATFSAPGEGAVVSETDEAKNVNNEVVENVMSREGGDPNGEFDFFNDASGGGNCWGANSAVSTFAVGNGKVPQGQIYPICPVSKVGYGAVRSTETEAGLQAPASGLPAAGSAGSGGAEARAAKTIFGYLATSPPQDQQCSWVKGLTTHLRFQQFAPLEVPARNGELNC